MSQHAVTRPDLADEIMNAAGYPTTGILGVHFARNYEVEDANEALEAADGVEDALAEHGLCIVERRLNTAAREILKLRKQNVPARDTRWKIAWRELEECCQ